MTTKILVVHNETKVLTELTDAMNILGCTVVTGKKNWKGSRPHYKQRLCKALNRAYRG